MKNRKEHFLHEVTNHIKSREAKEFVTTELEYHLQQAKKSWIHKGLNEEEAVDKAVEQMGSPIKLGLELNQLHRPRIDWWMIVFLVTAMMLGFFPMVALGESGLMDSSHFLINKLIFVILGVAVALGAMVVDFRKLENLGWVFYIMGSLILLMISFFPNVMINGQPFIKIGPITVECLMAVPFFFLAWASFFNNKQFKVWQFGLLFLPSLMLFLNIPNLSTTFIYIVMVFVMLWWSKLGKKKALMITVVPVCLSIIIGLFSWNSVKEYQLQRILGFLNPEKYADGAGYMYIRLKELMSTAGWFGTRGQMEFIPSSHTDMVFASLTHYYGYLFAVLLVLVLSFFIARMATITYKTNSEYGRLLLVGGITLYAVQFIYNIGMILGIFPITSISLPFISYGLMPTLFNAFIMGVVLSVYRRKDLILNRMT